MPKPQPKAPSLEPPEGLRRLRKAKEPDPTVLSLARTPAAPPGGPEMRDPEPAGGEVAELVAVPGPSDSEGPDASAATDERADPRPEPAAQAQPAPPPATVPEASPHAQPAAQPAAPEHAVTPAVPVAQSPEPGPEAKEKPKRQKLSFFVTAEEADRIKAAYANLPARVRPPALQYLLAAAVWDRVKEIEEEFNDGEPFDPLPDKNALIGRPIGS